MASSPTRIERDLLDHAKSVDAARGRSAAQQIAHWARIGYQLEASPTVSIDAVARVLRGDASYDALTDAAQAVVRAGWDEQLQDRTASLNLATEREATGVPWATADGTAA